MRLVRAGKVYSILVHTLPEDKLAQYVIQHNEYGVFETGTSSLLNAYRYHDALEKDYESYFRGDDEKPVQETFAGFRN